MKNLILILATTLSLYSCSSYKNVIPKNDNNLKQEFLEELNGFHSVKKYKYQVTFKDNSIRSAEFEIKDDSNVSGLDLAYKSVEMFLVGIDSTKIDMVSVTPVLDYLGIE